MLHFVRHENLTYNYRRRFLDFIPKMLRLAEIILYFRDYARNDSPADFNVIF